MTLSRVNVFVTVGSASADDEGEAGSNVKISVIVGPVDVSVIVQEELS